MLTVPRWAAPCWRPHDPQDVKTRARARAAAGSDARMSGCELPVVINSGSGNQGLTVSLPVIEYAQQLGADQEDPVRVLLISNLLSIHIKRHWRALHASAVPSAPAAGASAAITLPLQWYGIDQICAAIVSTYL
ncbi:MAG: L-serine ammonia-lyase, iron-sulfur-dependent, subunit alpha [Dysosmobacter sp.]